VVKADSSNSPDILMGLEAQQKRWAFAGLPDCQVSMDHPGPPCGGPPGCCPQSPVDSGARCAGGREAQGGCASSWWWGAGVASPVTERSYGGWLGDKRAPQGGPTERQDSWSNVPSATTLAELAGSSHRCQVMGQCHDEAKGVMCRRMLTYQE
jgi:hypothetical protein